MTERTRLISYLLCYLLYGIFSAILKVSTIKNTGSNFQHPRLRGHRRSCSLNWNESGDAIDTVYEKFWTWACDQLKARTGQRIKTGQQINTERYSHVTLVSGYSYLTAAHNMDDHYQVKHRLYKPWTLASNAWWIQENIARLAANQSARTIVAIRSLWS